MKLKQLHSDLWTVDSPLRFLGVELGTRMTMIRLPDSSLWVHSPIAMSPELLSEVKALGNVSYLIAPNRYHHLYIQEWKDHFPNASMFVASGLERKRTDLKPDGILQNEANPAWSEVLEQVWMQGFPLMNEVVFFHQPSQSLITTDLVFNIGSHSPLMTRLVFKLVGAYGSVSPSLVEKLFVKDKSAFRKSLECVLNWPFERVILGHGQVSEKGGREEIIQGYSWILE